MRKAPTFLAAVSGVLFLIPPALTAAPSPDTQWREKMEAAKDDESVGPLQEALKIAEKFDKSDPRLFETLVRLSAFCSYNDGCEDQANAYLERALRIRSNIKPQDAHFATLLSNLADAASDQGRSKDAFKVYREALALRENVFGSDDQVVAETYAAIAVVSQDLNDGAQARRTMQYALEIRQRAGKEQSAGFATLLEDSARLYLRVKDAARARGEYEHAISIRERLWGARDARFAASLKQIANHCRYGILMGFAETLYRRLVDVQKAAHTEKSEAYYQALEDLASSLQIQKRYGQAEETFQQALSVRERMGKKDSQSAACLERIARCRVGRGMYKEAAEAGETSLGILSSLPNPHESEIPLEGFLAETYLRAHDRKKSEACFSRMYSQMKPAHRYVLIDTAEELSKIYEERGDYPEAASKLELAVAEIESANASDARLPQQEIHLARLYQLMGRVSDANRMNMAAIRAMGQTVKAQGDPKRIQYFLIGVFVVFVAIPVVGTVVFALLFAWFVRKMDRRLALKYLPDAVPEPQEEVVTTATHFAFAGGFLGLGGNPVVAVPEPAVVTRNRRAGT